jgi:adenylate cyclase
MARIFVSYRRSDSAAIVGRIYDRLVARYRADSVFLDIDSMPTGADFRERISDTLRRCDIVLVVVGPGWLGARGHGRYRIREKDDPVRVEVEMALGAGISVVPVLVDGSIMPEPNNLPDGLKNFHFLNAARVDTNRDFHHHVDRLIRSLDQILQSNRRNSSAVLDKAEVWAQPAASHPVSGFDECPAIAVLPFANLRGDPDQQHFADGITDDIITELASWRSFPVIARGSTFAFKGRTVDIQTLSKELGARYIVEGSVNRMGQRVRITAQLVDASTGHYLVADRYDRDLAEVIDIQDEIVETIVGSIAPEVLKVGRDRVIRQRQQNATSYEHFIRGLEFHYRYNKEDNAEAQKFFRKAIEADPKNSRAHALLAHAMLYAVQHSWREDSEHNYETADKIAAQALRLDPRSPYAHFALGSTSMFLGRAEQALAEMEEAVRVNPSHAAAHAIMGHLLCYTGRPVEALESVKRALRLSPHDPRLGLWLPALAQAYYFLEQYEDAVAAARRALSLIPGNVIATRFMAAGFGELGMIVQAAPVVALLRKSREPTLAHQKELMEPIFRVPKMITHVLDGLQKAGMT